MLSITSPVTKEISSSPANGGEHVSDTLGEWGGREAGRGEGGREGVGREGEKEWGGREGVGSGERVGRVREGGREGDRGVSEGGKGGWRGNFTLPK